MANAVNRPTVGRYVLHDEIAAGGMATVHLGRLRGPVGFARTVAIKRLHPNVARDPEFVAMFLDEARLAARIRHPNVVPTIDVVQEGVELFLVMEYVAGESLARLSRPTRNEGRPIPVAIAIAIVADALHGLHEAHEARDENGAPLDIVHRDVSPHNVLVGIDGVARVLDFGIAKAASRITTTREGQLKGKIAYMAPEQLSQRPVDRRTDVFAAAIVLWEALTGDRLFYDNEVGSMMARVLHGDIPRPSEKAKDIPPALDAIVMRGLERDPDQRFPTAKAMATALEELGPARALQVSAWVESLAGDALRERAELLSAIEREGGSTEPAPPTSSANDVPTQILQDAPLPAPVVVEELPPPRRRRMGVIVFAILALAALLGGALMITRREETPAPATSAPPPPPATTSATVAPSPVVASVSTAPPVASSHAPVKPHPIKKTAAPPPPKSTCDPPFFIDAEGVKRFKPGCL
jgi:eukaryotic-like serine/threonine-protein kinase